MRLFAKKPAVRFDPETQEPAIRKSICTGEMTAGFVDKKTGHFSAVMMVKSVEEFQKATGQSKIKIIY